MIDNMNARLETAELVGLGRGGRPEAERVCALVASAEPAVVEDAGTRPAAASLVMFFALAYALSWAWWLPIAVSGGSVRRGDAWPTHLPGLLGPLIAAFVVLALTEGPAAVQRWLAAMALWPRERRWQLAALAPLGFLGLGLAALVVTGDVPPAEEFVRYSGTAASVGALAVAIAVNVFGEEAGWRGYALPRLQSRILAGHQNFSPLILPRLLHRSHRRRARTDRALQRDRRQHPCRGYLARLVQPRRGNDRGRRHHRGRRHRLRHRLGRLPRATRARQPARARQNQDRAMKRWGTRLHAAIYRLTRGRVLGRVGGQPVLLLETIGRRTGRRRTTPMQYLADGDTFLVVASNAGAARPPAWYLNLRANPHARAEVGPRTVDVRAHESTGQERADLWQQLTDANRYLEPAARKAERELPIIALVPTKPTTPRQ